MNWVVVVGSDVAIPVLGLPQFLMVITTPSPLMKIRFAWPTPSPLMKIRFASAGPGWFRHPGILFARDGANVNGAVIKTTPPHRPLVYMLAALTPAAAGQPVH